MLCLRVLPSLTNKLGVLPEMIPGINRIISVYMIRDFPPFFKSCKICIGFLFPKTQGIKPIQIYYPIVLEVRNPK